jgi:Carotenoid biosynthesis protein
MTTARVLTRWESVLLWSALLAYGGARVCQLYADRLPSLLIVVLHVVPPAVFALVHGSILYRVRGMVAFTGFCLGVAGVCEQLSLRTGFPFGHYYFTQVMGLKVLGLPLLLVLAYLGIGYCAWVLGLLILGYRDRPLTGARVVLLPLLASLLMLAWDLSMEADWSTVDRAWVWRDGGPFYGVPLSNFLGWYGTAYLFYQAFALYCRARPTAPAPAARSFWRVAIAFYGVCALGNLLILRLPMAPPVVTDPTGRQWVTMHILRADALISLLGMGPVTVAAWWRVGRRSGVRARILRSAQEDKRQTAS